MSRPGCRWHGSALARWRSHETKDGLEFTATLPEARADIREALERGDLSGAVSIGFYIEDGGDRWTHTKSQSMREVTQGHLSERIVAWYLQAAYSRALALTVRGDRLMSDLVSMRAEEVEARSRVDVRSWAIDGELSADTAHRA